MYALVWRAKLFKNYQNVPNNRAIKGYSVSVFNLFFLSHYLMSLSESGDGKKAEQLIKQLN